MRLIDLDAKIIVPITDETKGGMVYEAQMTVGELFSRFLPDFQPEIVDAIPVEWIVNKAADIETYVLKCRRAWSLLVYMWEREE